MITETGNNLNHLAIHEAGHAVVGRMLGMVCGQVTIVADHDSTGHSITLDPWDTVSHWESEGRFRVARTAFLGGILTLMAGAEAEKVILGHCEGGDGNDQREIARTFGSVDFWIPEKTGDEFKDHAAYEQRLRNHCRATIRRHRSRIEMVAQLLLDRKTIEGEVLDKMIKPIRPKCLELPWWATHEGAQ